MIPLYKNNYVKTSGHGKDFFVTFDKLPSKFNNYYIESCRAAEEIYSLKQGKIHILYSGGIDSEYCLNIFLSMGIDVIPVIIKLNPGYNKHDIDYAFKFCQSKNIKPLIIDIDFLNFIESGKLVEITHEIKASTFGRAPIAYAAGLLDGTVILGDGQPYIQLNKKDNIWYMIEKEHDFSIYNYFIKHNIHGTAHFNRFTPEMFASFMTDQRMVELTSNQAQGKSSNNTSRDVIYNRHSRFNLEVRPKYHGFEFIHLYPEIRKNEKIFKDLTEFGKQYEGIFSVSYQEFMKTNIG